MPGRTRPRTSPTSPTSACTSLAPCHRRTTSNYSPYQPGTEPASTRDATAGSPPTRPASTPWARSVGYYSPTPRTCTPNKPGGSTRPSPRPPASSPSSPGYSTVAMAAATAPAYKPSSTTSPGPGGYAGY